MEIETPLHYLPGTPQAITEKELMDMAIIMIIDNITLYNFSLVCIKKAYKLSSWEHIIFHRKLS